MSQPAKCMRFLREFFIFLLLFSSVLAYTPRSCQGNRFRVSASELEKIRGCDVMEGNLVIELIEDSKENWRKYGNLTLKEITGYLMFYDVQNLRSLDIILPNLSVIRGRTLFGGEYALVIYLLSDMEEVNLSRLTNIVDGSVYINRNVALSYISTVNFDSIVQSDSHKNHIQSDKPRKCNTSCTSGHCWSLNSCQPSCSNCVIRTDGKEDDEMCSDQCMGGCYKNDETSCVACKNFRYHARCLRTCGQGKYEFDGYKCVTEEECKAEYRVIYENTCVTNCPWNHEPRYEQQLSIPTCVKSSMLEPCKGGMISSVLTSRRFHGCKKINGSLHIRLSGSASDNIVELEKNLGQIEEVLDSVIIFDSSVMTLGFLKKLKLIRGRKLLQNSSSLIIRDCKNLMRLWQPDGKLIVKEGDIQIYRNPKLCPDVIEDLLGSAIWERYRLPNPYDFKYSQSSRTQWILNGLLNGFENACQKTIIRVEAKAMQQKGVIQLALPRMLDTQNIKNLVGYLIYYKEAPQDIIFKGTNSIDDSWVLDYVAYNDEGGQILRKEIENLKPATRYAFFVRIETVPFSVSYQTDIFYKSTERFNPTVARDMKFVQNEKTITLSWSPPKNTHGTINFYHIIIKHRQDSVPDSIKQYCNNEVVRSVIKKVEGNTVRPFSNSGNENEASSRTRNTLSKGEIDELEIQLTNYVYFNQTSTRKSLRRDLTRYIGDEEDINEQMLNHDSEKEDRMGDIFGLTQEVSTTHQQSHIEVNRAEKLELLKFMIYQEPSLEKLQELVIPLIKHEPILQKYMKNLEETNVHKLKVEVDSLISGELPLEDQPEAQQFECSGNTNTGHLTQEPHFTTDTLNNSRYMIEVRACHNVTDKFNHEDLDAKNNGKCWLCSPPLKREICVLYPDADIRVQNVSIEHLNASAIKIRWKPPNFPIQPEEIFSYAILIKSHSPDIPISPVSSCANSTEREKILLISSPPGKYTVRVAARLHCDYGNRTYSDEQIIEISHIIPWSSGMYVYLPIIIVFCSIIIFIGLIIWSINKIDGMKNFEILNNILYGSSKPRWKYYFEKSGLPPELLHYGENLDLEGLLGDGNFGIVHRGVLSTKKGKLEVAAKQLKNVGKSSEMCEMLINEAKIMLQLRSYYLVQTYGLVSSRYDIYLVMELMSKGTVQAFLKNRRRGEFSNTPVGSEMHLLRISIQIADGMFYLETKSIIHRDLAARNCLLDDKYNAKISDFGMSRIANEGIYKIRSNQKVPLRRMPPEYFLRMEFTVKSDVWSYGILLWELSMNKNALPYEHLTDPEMEQEIKKGLTLYSSLPISTPVYFSTVMNQCWKTEPQERPCFNHIITTLLAHAKQFNIVEEFEEKSFTYCGEIEEDQVYSAMSSAASVLCGKCDSHELSVETPLTLDPRPDSVAAKEIHELKDHSNITLGKRARARVLQIKESIIFHKIFPFTLGAMHDGSMRKRDQRQDAFIRVL